MLKSRRLRDVQVASPCTASWDDMSGTDRERFCRACQRTVYNLSAMSREEAEALVRLRQSRRVCIRFYRRADGTMLTADCPVGLRALRRAALRSWAALGGCLVAVLGLFVAAISPSTAERRKPWGGGREVEPFATLLAWLDPHVPDPEPTPPPVKPADPWDVKGWRLGW